MAAKTLTDQQKQALELMRKRLGPVPDWLQRAPQATRARRKRPSAPRWKSRAGHRAVQVAEAAGARQRDGLLDALGDEEVRRGPRGRRRRRLSAVRARRGPGTRPSESRAAPARQAAGAVRNSFMAHVVNTELMDRIRRFGAFDVSACFNCGNCTAVCPLSKDGSNFPRRLIRYGQVGMEDRLLADKDLWMCHYCGECSQTCPRQAEPGEYMASARRYAISRYDPTGLQRPDVPQPDAYRAAVPGVVGRGGRAAAVAQGRHERPAAEAVRVHPGPGDSRDRRGGVRGHRPGRAVRGLVDGAALPGGAAAAADAHCRSRCRLLASAAGGAVAESLSQSRYRLCDSEPPVGRQLRPKPWLVHAMILWGFLANAGGDVAGLRAEAHRLAGRAVVADPACSARFAGWSAWPARPSPSTAGSPRPRPGYAHTRLADGFFLGLLAAVVCHRPGDRGRRVPAAVAGGVPDRSWCTWCWRST